MADNPPDLDKLSEMLRIIQGKSETPEPVEDSNFFNTGLSREEISNRVDRADEKAKQDQSYEFTKKILDQALADMLPYVLRTSKDNSPFDEAMREAGLSPFVVKKHLAEMLVGTLRLLPLQIQKEVLEDIQIGQAFQSLLIFVVTEMVFILRAAKTADQQD